MIPQKSDWELLIFLEASVQQPQEVMKGIQQILEVARRDSLNMYAQFMLGLGGIESGQFDKAIQRLLKVVQFDPGNLEAVLSLGEAYERTVIKHRRKPGMKLQKN